MVGLVDRATRVHPTTPSRADSNVETATTLEAVIQAQFTSQCARVQVGRRKHVSSNAKVKSSIKLWSSKTQMFVEALVGESSPFLTTWAQTRKVRRRLRQRRTYSWNRTTRTNFLKRSTSVGQIATWGTASCVKWRDTSTTSFRKMGIRKHKKTTENRLFVHF